jgi:L-asparaginase II
MVEVWRGDIAESYHRGHAAVCDAAGSVRAAWGDPDAVILPRSSCKMIQALPLVESGAADGLGTVKSRMRLAFRHLRGVLGPELAEGWDDG